jgi:hypothetical protein
MVTIYTICNYKKSCEISSSHGGEYDVQSCLLGYTVILHGSITQKTALNIKNPAFKWFIIIMLGVNSDYFLKRR